LKSPFFFFFLGRHDRHVDAKLAANYFETLRGPMKVLHWFEPSAHNVPFDEPRLFNERVARDSVDQGAVGSVMIATRNIIRQLLALGVEPDPVPPPPAGCTPIGGPSCVVFDTFARHPREKVHGTSG
jgi:hypothetical protein